jgi:hypothetical protein
MIPAPETFPGGESPDHSQPSRGSKPFSEIPRRRRHYLSCEWPDSNRHGVTHWYLNPPRRSNFSFVRAHHLSAVAISQARSMS